MGGQLNVPVSSRVRVGGSITREELLRDDSLIQYLSLNNLYGVEMGKKDRALIARGFVDVNRLVNVSFFWVDVSNPYPVGERQLAGDRPHGFHWPRPGPRRRHRDRANPLGTPRTCTHLYAPAVLKVYWRRTNGAVPAGIHPLHLAFHAGGNRSGGHAQRGDLSNRRKRNRRAALQPATGHGADRRRGRGGGDPLDVRPAAAVQQPAQRADHRSGAQPARAGRLRRSSPAP